MAPVVDGYRGPSLAKASAMALPIPNEDPSITATLF